MNDKDYDLTQELMNYEAMALANSNSLRKAKEQSIGGKQVEYDKKKKVNGNRLRTTIAAWAMAAVAFIAGAKTSEAIVKDRNEVVPITREYKSEIDNKILSYEKMMGENGEDGKKIVIRDQYNPDAGTFYHHFAEGTLINNIIVASQISDIEVRCVLIAAYNLVDEPYRDQVFEKVFDGLEEKKDALNSDYDFRYLTGGSVKAFLEWLGYNDWHDYQMAERKNIKALGSVEAYVKNNARGK